MPYSEHKWRARRSNNSRPTNSLPCKPIKNNITNKKDLKCKGANRNFHVFRVYFLLVSRNTQVLFTSYSYRVVITIRLLSRKEFITGRGE